MEEDPAELRDFSDGECAEEGRVESDRFYINDRDKEQHRCVVELIHARFVL